MYIVDIQGFQLTNKSFVAKEVAVCTLHSGQIAHFVLQPPLNQYPDSKSQWYLQSYHHGIEWDRGFVPYENLKNLLEDIITEDDKVLCKGLEKCLFLQNLLQRHITNLDTMACPKLAKLREKKVKCVFHNGEYFNCALQNVTVLRLWIMAKMNFSEFVKTVM